MSRRVAGVVLALAVAVGGAACEKVNTVASSVSPCFRILPEAHAALGGQGTFVDVARVRRGSVPHFGGFFRRNASPTPSSTALPVQRDVCLVAYRGTFDPSKINPLVGTARTGKYAVVVVGITSRKVRGVALVDTLPSPLHAH